MCKSDLWNFIVLTLIFVLIELAASFTYIGTLIVSGPLICGYYYIILKKMRGGQVNIGDLAKGFNFFVPALLAYLLIAIFTAIGLVFCIVPGLVIGARYQFTFPLIVDKKLGFWEAMEESRKIIWPHIFQFTLFIIVIGLIGILGVLLCCVGTLITTPICLCSLACAYRDMVGLTDESKSQTLISY
ncbi:MAG: hypothetical protein N2246_05540 [Candidatus Sumerlaeia bacterium]|nr:hypothetical protein [Candidatus Sumerlaeia bacterium]